MNLQGCASGCGGGGGGGSDGGGGDIRGTSWLGYGGGGSDVESTIGFGLVYEREREVWSEFELCYEMEMKVLKRWVGESVNV